MFRVQSRPLRLLAGVGTLSLAAVLAGCGAGDDSAEPTSDSTGDFPVTVSNCEADVTFDAAPERVVMLKSATVPYLHDLGVMDRVTARAGQYPEEYYDDETLAELDDVPVLTDEVDPAGHLQISKEVVIAEEPDLVLGQVDNLSRETLSAVDVPLLEEPALCPEGAPSTASFDDISDQMRLYGQVFGRGDQAEDAVADLEQERQKIEDEVGGPSGRTAAVLYPTVGGGPTYAYGTSSMAHPQLEAAGLENVFGDTDERVFEVTLEELLGRDPDIIVLLYTDGEPGKVEDALTSLPGADELTAVREDQVMTQLFNFTEPPSPLSVTGLRNIVDRFGDGR